MTDPTSLLRPWMVRQRWFAAKGASSVDARLLQSLPVPVEGPGVRAAMHVVEVTTSGATATYLVPLTYRDTADPALAGALVGTLGVRGREG